MGLPSLSSPTDSSTINEWMALPLGSAGFIKSHAGCLPLKSPNSRKGRGSCLMRDFNSSIFKLAFGEQYIEQIVYGFNELIVTATVSKVERSCSREYWRVAWIRIATPLFCSPAKWGLLSIL